MAVQWCYQHSFCFWLFLVDLVDLVGLVWVMCDGGSRQDFVSGSHRAGFFFKKKNPVR